METKGGYKKMQSGYNHNMSDYSAEAGENITNYSSSGGGNSGMSAGVGDGLSMTESASDVKNAEHVSQNERPKARRTSAGKGYKIGT